MKITFYCNVEVPGLNETAFKVGSCSSEFIPFPSENRRREGEQ